MYCDREPGPADSPRRTSGPPPGGNTADSAGRDPYGGWLVYSVHKAARLTGLSRDLLNDQMRRGNVAYVKASTWHLLTCQRPQQFPDITS
jgi:hypothetical protein